MDFRLGRAGMPSGVVRAGMGLVKARLLMNKWTCRMIRVHMSGPSNHMGMWETRCPSTKAKDEEGSLQNARAATK
jgi:hypothetical protein